MYGIILDHIHMHVLFESTDSAWILIALKTNPEFGEAMRKSILLTILYM